MCFAVHPAHRRQGIARRLLDEACSMLRDLGLEYVDAYPLADPRPGRDLPLSAVLYHGPLSMYRDAGFEELGRPAPGSSPFVQVRKRLL